MGMRRFSIAILDLNSKPRRVVGYSPRLLYSRRKRIDWVDLRAGLDAVEKRINFVLAGINPKSLILLPVSISTELPGSNNAWIHGSVHLVMRAAEVGISVLTLILLPYCCYVPDIWLASPLL
jgi:hypothetical protein